MDYTQDDGRGLHYKVKLLQDGKSIENAPQHDTAGSQQVTPFSDSEEDHMRKLLYTIFDLPPLQLLLMQAIFRGKSLSDFANDTTKLFNQYSGAMSRHRAFYIRQRLYTDHPEFKTALQTFGQVKPLKKKASTK